MRINNFSFQAVEVTIFEASTTSKVMIPADDSGGVASSAPLGGYFTISCKDPYTN